MLLLVALAPFLFAVASWNPRMAARPFQDFALTYSLPISAIEIAVIFYAVSTGFRMSQALAALPRWARPVLGLLAALALATAALAANPPHSSLRTCQLLIHVVFGFSACGLFRTRWAPLRGQVWPWVLAGTCLYVFTAVAWVLAVHDQPDFDWRRFSLGVIHIRQTGFYSAVGAAAAIGVASTARTREGYWLAVAGASLLLALSYWSGTRGALTAVLGAFVAGLIFLPALRSLRAVGALAVSGIAGALISLPFPPPHPWYGLLRISETAAAGGADELATGRLRMWQAALDAIAERPFFGYGESQFGVAVPDWSQFNHPHNIFIQILVQWGLVGFLCYFALAALLARQLIVRGRLGAPDTAAPFLVAGALFTMGLYEGSLYHPYPLMIFALSAAFVLAGPVPNTPSLRSS